MTNADLESMPFKRDELPSESIYIVRATIFPLSSQCKTTLFRTFITAPYFASIAASTEPNKLSGNELLKSHMYRLHRFPSWKCTFTYTLSPVFTFSEKENKFKKTFFMASTMMVIRKFGKF